ncbi:MAG: DTW domain-containing protein [Proteobacteria bacterium]|nr:DTW domain-containing protein [Pseudomonadota bacterium]
MTSERAGTRRPSCARCLRPAAACLCAAVRPVEAAVQVLILMHPLEQHQAKGTARLAHLCLAGSRLVVGEAFAPADLERLLQQPWCAADRLAPRRALLLYPATAPDAPCAAPPALPAQWLDTPARLRLVVLDGSWRKSRKMLWLNPALQALPRLALQQAPASRYAIRKAHAPHQLSTLEATQQALQQLEPGNAGIARLADAMDGFMAQQQAYLPAMLGAS